MTLCGVSNTISPAPNERGRTHVRLGSQAERCSAKGMSALPPNSDRESGFPQKEYRAAQ